MSHPQTPTDQSAETPRLLFAGDQGEALRVEPAFFVPTQTEQVHTWLPPAVSEKSASAFAQDSAESASGLERHVSDESGSATVVGEAQAALSGLDETPQDLSSPDALNPEGSSDLVVDCPRCDETRAEAASERQALDEALRQPYTEGAARFTEAAFELSQRVQLDTVRLALELARQVLNHEASLGHEVLETSLKKALASAGPLEKATVICHPEDLRWVESHAESMATSAPGRQVELTYETSDDVERGGCQVRFSEGSVDARLSQQLQALGAVVEDVILAQRAGDEEDVR